MLIKKFLFINLLDQEGEEREGESYSFWLSEFFNLEIGGRRVPLFSLIMWVEMCNSNTRSCILHLVASLVPPSSSKVLSKAMKPFNSSFPRGVRWWCIPQHQLQLIHSDIWWSFGFGLKMVLLEIPVSRGRSFVVWLMLDWHEDNCPRPRNGKIMGGLWSI